MPFILTHNVAAIVPDEIYPADASSRRQGGRLGPVHAREVHAQPAGGVQEEPELQGGEQGQTENFIVQYFEQLRRSSSRSRTARSTSPTAACRRPTSRTCATTARKGVTVVDGAGTEIRYIVFNVEKKPVNKAAVRKAIAQVHRSRGIAENGSTRAPPKPLYSTVPAAFPGAKESFKDAFGDPDPAKAKAILDEAGVTTPVELDGWYTPTHYGPVEADLWNEIKRQLEAAALQGQARLDRVGPVQGRGLRQGHVRLLRARLVPGLPGRGQLPAAAVTTARDGGFFQNNYSDPEVDEGARHGARRQTTRPSARRPSARSRTTKPRTCH